MAYGVNDVVPGPSETAGQPNATGAADSSIRASTWPYKRTADRSIPHNILLRPPDPLPVSDDPTIDAIYSLADVMQQVQRATRLISAPWLIEPPDSESFHLASGIAIPAQDGLFHTVVTITCPAGRNGVLNRIANEFVGSGFVDFGGSIVYQIVRNPTSGITAAERNYQNITASLGSVQDPARISGIRIFENDVLAIVVKNVSIVPGGELIGGLLGGYFYPRTWDDQFDAHDRPNDW
jgi:hypothetical protein